MCAACVRSLFCRSGAFDLETALKATVFVFAYVHSRAFLPLEQKEKEKSNKNTPVLSNYSHYHGHTLINASSVRTAVNDTSEPIKASLHKVGKHVVYEYLQIPPSYMAESKRLSHRLLQLCALSSA